MRHELASLTLGRHYRAWPVRARVVVERWPARRSLGMLASSTAPQWARGRFLIIFGYLLGT
jgi:hypothetical protein